MDWNWRAPDYLGPIVAARAWRVALPSIAQPVRIRRVPLEPLATTSYEWRPGTNTALCHRLGHPSTTNQPHIPPVPTCACGFWGLNDATTLWSYLTEGISTPHDRHHFLIWGTVELWGTVIPGDLGWRAELAKVTSFVDAPQVPVIRYTAPTLNLSYSAEALVPSILSMPVNTVLDRHGGWAGRSQMEFISEDWDVPLLDDWPPLTPPHEEMA